MNRSRKAQRGVSLIEAMVTFVVAGIGLLGFVAIQGKIRVGADVSRQRSEAVRIAQENLENLRAFGTLANDGTVANNLSYDAGVVSGTTSKTVLASGVATSTNAAYTLTQNITASTQAGMKDVFIRVTWTDRENTNQSIVLRSVIGRSDPRLAAALAIPPNGSPVKDPLGRDMRVPIPAQDLGDGTSVFKPNASGAMAFIFNNDTGNITSKCTAVPATVTTAQITAASLSGYSCVAVDGRLLSGYVRFSYGSNPSATSPNGAAMPLSIRIDLDATAPPAGMAGTLAQLTSAYWPSPAGPANHSGYSTPDCASQDSKTVRFQTPVNYTQTNDGVVQTVSSTYVTAIVPVSTAVTPEAIAPHVNLPAASVQSPTDLGERYVAYTCVVYPRDFGGVKAWTGRSLIVPSGWTIGTASSTYKVCRYSEDYNLNGYVWTVSGSNVDKIDNAEHPYAYLYAGIGYNNQNFLIIEGNRSCPTDGPVEVDGQGGENYTNETTVVHQTF